MTNRIINDEEFSNLMKLHTSEIIELLMKKGQFFSILTNITNVYFNPPLPNEISSSLKPITLFIIADYTFESSSIDDDNLYFEAGFGKDNIGSYVSVPLDSIVQILVDDTPIFINLAIAQNRKSKKESIKKSTNIFLSNPENKNIVKSNFH